MKCLSMVLLTCFIALPMAVSAAPSMESSAAKPLPPIPLSLDELHAWIDRSHPLLKGAGTEKVMARGKMLKALGAFEPTLVNDTEVERFIDKTTSKTQTAGFNDTLVEARHPWGFRGSAGVRQSIGEAKIPDLSFGSGHQQQAILGGFFPLSQRPDGQPRKRRTPTLGAG